THGLHTLLNPASLFRFRDMAKFRADRIAIGCLQYVDDFAQRRLILAYIGATNLKNRIQIRFTQLMKLKLEIRYRRALPKPQRIQTRFLVAALAVCAHQLQNAHLLALMLRHIDVAGAQTYRRFGQLLELQANDRMRRVGTYAVDAGQTGKIITPGQLD